MQKALEPFRVHRVLLLGHGDSLRHRRRCQGRAWLDVVGDTYGHALEERLVLGLDIEFGDLEVGVVVLLTKGIHLLHLVSKRWRLLYFLSEMLSLLALGPANLALGLVLALLRLGRAAAFAALSVLKLCDETIRAHLALFGATTLLRFAFFLARVVAVAGVAEAGVVVVAELLKEELWLVAGVALARILLDPARLRLPKLAELGDSVNGEVRLVLVDR